MIEEGDWETQIMERLVFLSVLMRFAKRLKRMKYNNILDIFAIKYILNANKQVYQHFKI
jgi:hypothetical protein